MRHRWGELTTREQRELNFQLMFIPTVLLQHLSPHAAILLVYLVCKTRDFDLEGYHQHGVRSGVNSVTHLYTGLDFQLQRSGWFELIGRGILHEKMPVSHRVTEFEIDYDAVLEVLIDLDIDEETRQEINRLNREDEEQES